MKNIKSKGFNIAIIVKNAAYLSCILLKGFKLAGCRYPELQTMIVSYRVM